MKKFITLILVYASLFAKKSETQNVSINNTGALLQDRTSDTFFGNDSDEKIHDWNGTVWKALATE